MTRTPSLPGPHPTAPTRPEDLPHDPAVCWDCWIAAYCYGCGEPVTAPRREHTPDVEQHPGDPSHRWCFE